MKEIGEGVIATCIILVGLFLGAAISKPRSVQSAPASMTPASTVAEHDANHSVAVPSLEHPSDPEPEGFAKHYFRVAVDDGRFCAICGASIYNTIHPWKNVSESETQPPAEPPAIPVVKESLTTQKPVYQRRRLFGGRFRR